MKALAIAAASLLVVAGAWADETPAERSITSARVFNRKS